MDERDLPTWVAIELSRLGEQKVERGEIEEAISAYLREIGSDATQPLFVPAVCYKRAGRSSSSVLMDGYIFMQSGLPEIEYFRLERSPLVNAVMSTKGPDGIRILTTIQDSHIRQMRQELHTMACSGMQVGDPAIVVDGVYEGMSGDILSIEEDMACVHFKLRSLEMIAEIPVIALSPHDPEAKPSFLGDLVIGAMMPSTEHDDVREEIAATMLHPFALDEEDESEEDLDGDDDDEDDEEAALRREYLTSESDEYSRSYDDY